MPSILSDLKSKYPNLNFEVGDQFYWSPSLQTIYYVSPLTSSSDSINLLHEVAHALLNHASYKKDIDLIKMERDSWDKTVELAPDFGLSVSDDDVSDAMDSYRQWIYRRSLCPSCGASGLEVDNKTFSCIACNSRWTANEARTCGLKRYVIK